MWRCCRHIAAATDAKRSASDCRFTFGLGTPCTTQAIAVSPGSIAVATSVSGMRRADARCSSAAGRITSNIALFVPAMPSNSVQSIWAK
jgi:hypothetical protein